MSLDPLLEDVFQKGCGVSRVTALRSPRYVELLSSVPYVTRTTPSEVAELMLLGEELADRAFQNLPPFFRNTAAEWAANPNTQDPLQDQIIFDMMMKRFTNAAWWKIRGEDDSSERVSTRQRTAKPRGFLFEKLDV